MDVLDDFFGESPLSEQAQGRMRNKVFELSRVLPPRLIESFGKEDMIKRTHMFNSRISSSSGRAIQGNSSDT